MRDDLKKKAWLATILLSVALLGLGFGLGRILPLQQSEETNQLISQATEKVLLLTQEKQALEERIQSMLAAGAQASPLVWEQQGAYYGLLRPTVVFNQELGVSLVGQQAGAAQLKLNWQGRNSELNLKVGQQISLANNWRLELQALGPGWAIVALLDAGAK